MDYLFRTFKAEWRFALNGMYTFVFTIRNALATVLNGLRLFATYEG